MTISTSLRNKILLCLSLTLLGLSVYVIHHLVKTVSYADIVHEVKSMTWTQLGLALLSTIVSYIALGWTEVISLKMARITFPASKAFFSAFIAQSIVHLTGFSILLGAVLRYRFYAPYGLKVSDVTRAQVFFSSGFALSTIFLLAMTLILDPTLAAEEVGGSLNLWRALGGGMLVLFGVALHYMKSNKPIHIFNFTLRHAGGEASAASFPLIIASILDMVACAGALYVLLPAALNISFLGLLAAFLIAMSLSVTSNVPGGLGIIEAAILTLLNPTQDLIAPTIGALLMFRAIYYVVPFLLSLALQGIALVLKLRSFAKFLAGFSKKERKD